MKELGKVPVLHHLVDEASIGQRVDNFLVRFCKGVPKPHLYRLLRSGQVRVNGGRIGPDYRLQAGDDIRIPPMDKLLDGAPKAIPAGQPLTVVFEDEGLLVVNKPSGLAVHGGSGVSFGVIEQLRRQRPEAKFLELAHRLDRETSGLLLIAKKRAVLVALHDMFREGRMQKRYLTLVSGRWRDALRHVKLPLEKLPTDDGDRRVRVSDQGKPAHSIVRMKARWENFSFLEVEIKTGRTHQIRVHLTHLGYPLCGDDKYGDYALNKTFQKNGLKRLFLHATNLVFDHPVTGQLVELNEPLPKELASFIARIEKNETRDYGD